MSVYDHKCADCQTCPECGRSAWCEGDRILIVPCEHKGYCGDCNVENCADCRREAFDEMAETGTYDPRADPLYDHTKAAEAQHWWEHRRDGTTFDPVTNSYAKRKP